MALREQDDRGCQQVKPFVVKWNDPFPHTSREAARGESRRYALATPGASVEVRKRADGSYRLHLVGHAREDAAAVFGRLSDLDLARLAQLRTVVDLVECGAVTSLPEASPWL